MQVNKTISKEGLKWRCREHPNAPCDFICLDGDAKDRVMCFNCTQKQQIPVSNLISMSFVLACKEQDILEAYPLKDQKLASKLRNTSSRQQLEEIEAYCKKLKEDFAKEVQAAEQRAKESLIKQERVQQEVLEEYARIVEVEKLKQLIVSEKESAEKDLDNFIKEKWGKAEENRNVMEDLMDQYDEQYFSFDEPNRIAQEITQSLKSIDFFQQSIQEPQALLIKSTQETIIIDNSIYLIKRQGTSGNRDYIFIDPKIKSQKKYILHFELEMKQENKNNCFWFGLVQQGGKDNSRAYGQYMCYNDYSNGHGITKYINGSPMQSETKITGKHSFEVRIYLDQKFLRVASLPGYSQIAELDDSKNNINPKVTYRFFLSMYNQGDMMKVTNMRTVSEFDDKM